MFRLLNDNPSLMTIATAAAVLVLVPWSDIIAWLSRKPAKKPCGPHNPC